MTIRITITESDFLEIMRWEDEGGSIWDLLYEVIPDELPHHDSPLASPEDNLFAKNNLPNRAETKAA